MKSSDINKLQNDTMGLVLTNHTPKGFQKINPKDNRYATLSWGMFDEIHETKLIERYNNTLYNARTEKIVKFITSDTLYNKYQIDAAVFAWQIDPLASKYPQHSPYSAFNNNPILYIDADGREWVNPYKEKLANLQESALKNPNDKDIAKQVTQYQALSDRSDKLIQNIKTNDEALYNYIDKLSISDNIGNSRNIKVFVSVEGGISGSNRQVGETNYLKSSSDPNANYNGNQIIAPITQVDGKMEIGFSVKIWDSPSFADERLANEAGDIMFYMEYNKDAVAGKSNDQYFQQGQGGKDAYMNDSSSKYSTKVEDKYRDRKKGKESKSNNPYPLKKD